MTDQLTSPAPSKGNAPPADCQHAFGIWTYNGVDQLPERAFCGAPFEGTLRDRDPSRPLCPVCAEYVW